MEKDTTNMDMFKLYLDSVGAKYTINGENVTIDYAPMGTANQIRDLPYQVEIVNEKVIDYSSLVVRVAGFSAYWNDCHKEVQDQILARTKQRL